MALQSALDSPGHRPCYRRMLPWPCTRVQAFSVPGMARRQEHEAVFEIPRRLKYENKRRRSSGDSPISLKARTWVPTRSSQ